MISMNIVVRAILAIVGGLLALYQLDIMVNTHSINVLGLVLIVVGIFLLLLAINPKVLEFKHWWQFWK
jgi:uncharacterized membrane protein HdeD (DUF308 family)